MPNRGARSGVGEREQSVGYRLRWLKRSTLSLALSLQGRGNSYGLPCLRYRLRWLERSTLSLALSRLREREALWFGYALLITHHHWSFTARYRQTKQA